MAHGEERPSRATLLQPDEIAPLCCCSSIGLSHMTRSCYFAFPSSTFRLAWTYVPTAHPIHHKTTLHPFWGFEFHSRSPQPLLNIPSPHKRKAYSHLHEITRKRARAPTD